MQEAAKKIALLGVKHVVIKGGARLDTKQTLELHYDGKSSQSYPHPVIDTPYNHGAGCTFGSHYCGSGKKLSGGTSYQISD